jgi:hypothetical protein
MRAHYPYFIDRGFSVTRTRRVSMAVVVAILAVTLATTSGSILAAGHDSDGAAVQTTIDAGEREQQEALAAEIKANLAAFDRMEQVPELFTRHSGATAWATSAEIEANLAAFVRKERTPRLFTRVSKENVLTHPWGGDALTPDY